MIIELITDEYNTSLETNQMWKAILHNKYKEIIVINAIFDSTFEHLKHRDGLDLTNVTNGGKSNSKKNKI